MIITCVESHFVSLSKPIDFSNELIEFIFSHRQASMIYEICRVLACLAAGEVLSRFCPLPIPGTVIGLALLLTWLCVLGRVPENLSKLADYMLGMFGLFFVPAGVGFISHVGLITADFTAIFLVIFIGTFVTIASVGLSIKLLARSKDQ